MCNIKVGELITFVLTGLVVKVASDDSIEYDGRIYKLSPFVGTFMPETSVTPQVHTKVQNISRMMANS